MVCESTFTQARYDVFDVTDFDKSTKSIEISISVPRREEKVPRKLELNEDKTIVIVDKDKVYIYNAKFNSVNFKSIVLTVRCKAKMVRALMETIPLSLKIVG